MRKMHTYIHVYCINKYPIESFLQYITVLAQHNNAFRNSKKMKDESGVPSYGCGGSIVHVGDYQSYNNVDFNA